jgi:hypothetical protein
MCPSTSTAGQDCDGLKGSEIGSKEDLNSNFTWYDQRLLHLIIKAFIYLFILIFFLSKFFHLFTKTTQTSKTSKLQSRNSLPGLYEEKCITH